MVLKLFIQILVSGGSVCNGARSKVCCAWYQLVVVVVVVVMF